MEAKMGVSAAPPRGWILVTGGSRGIGRGLVDALAREGYEIIFTYKDSGPAAAQLEEGVRIAGGKAQGHCLDHTDEAAVQAFAADQLERRGAPYAIVNNVGVTRDVLMMQMTSHQWHEVVETNLNSAFYVTRPFVTAMAEQGNGVVLQISSVAGLKGVAGQVNYSSTKAALGAFTRSLALELGRFNVRVNAIAPGYIATDMTQSMSDAQRKSIKNSVPLRRIGTVEDVSALAVFLMNPSASYMTGQTFVVDGGLTA